MLENSHQKINNIEKMLWQQIYNSGQIKHRVAICDKSNNADYLSLFVLLL